MRVAQVFAGEKYDPTLADGERAAWGALHVSEGEADLLELDEGLFGKGLEGFAGTGERDLAAAAIEKAMAEVGLERPDLRGDRGLCDVQLFCGAGEALLSRHFEKRGEPIEVQSIPRRKKRRSFEPASLLIAYVYDLNRRSL